MWNQQQVRQPITPPINPPVHWNQQPVMQPRNPTVEPNHNNGERDSFLAYLHSMKTDMQTMKADIEKSVKEIINESVIQRLSTEQRAPPQQMYLPNQRPNPQIITAQNQNPMSANPPHQIQQNMQAYHQMFPAIPSR